MITQERFNEQNVKTFYGFLNHKEQTELRFIKPRWKKDKSKPIQTWVNNEKEFIDTCKKYNTEYNIYVGLNERTLNGDKDADVKFITNVGHDIDSHEDNNLDVAKAVALSIKKRCVEFEYKEPFVMCSGRGYWVIHNLKPIKNTEINSKKIKEFGNKIIKRHTKKGIEIDSTVYNASRIVRVPGTLNISDEKNQVLSYVVENGSSIKDERLSDDILKLEVKQYNNFNVATIDKKDSCAFLDYCLTHEVPSGERHKIISRNMSIYICDSKDRELLKEQYCKIQKGSSIELDQWLKSVDEQGKDKYPFSCGQLINFQKKWKISLKCKGCPKYLKWKQEQKEEYNARRINERIKKIKDKDYSELQKQVFTDIISRNKEKATERIVEEIERINHIYTTRDDVKSEMWVYKEGIYVPQGKSYVKEFTRRILCETFTPQLANQVIAKIETDTFIEHDEFFSKNYIDLIPVKNGILNIFTKELSEHTPDKIFFNKIPVYYDPVCECPNVLKHFDTILKNKDDIPVLLELFGFLLLKEYKIEKAFMFVGHGRNGKSKTIELMKRFIGAENCAGIPLRSLNEGSFSLSELFGKMANMAADLSKADLKETGVIKALIGRDFIESKRKYLRDLNFVNYAKMIFAANELPKIYDTTDGFWTKWVLIEFPYKFVNKKVYDILSEEEKKKHKIMDPDIVEKLTTDEELSGLLNLALDNLKVLLKEKDFSYSKNTKDVKDIWIRKSDSFTAFCYDHLEENDIEEISKKDLKQQYHKYRKKHKVSGCSEKAIRITLDIMFGTSDRDDWQTRQRYWEGLCFKNLDKL